ncbi:hypothetical protein A2V61_01190 [Candidatus Woesebacteria bacterium RBG_19FT_COMBO_47_8]|nr:MAG: hypothetical protein A2V61_01190 [Candidatus Woesebacteria bacterium RBG_19FT_COMBO_47_8]
MFIAQPHRVIPEQCVRSDAAGRDEENAGDGVLHKNRERNIKIVLVAIVKSQKIDKSSPKRLRQIEIRQLAEVFLKVTHVFLEILAIA